jgi:hypothetical protein
MYNDNNNIQELILHSNDIMTNVCNFIKDDIKCLAHLIQTNKQIRDIVIKNTLYNSQKENIINAINFEKMFRYVRIYSESIVNNNNNNIIEYFSKIQDLTPYMVSSHLYTLNVELCLNYCSINYLINNSPKYMNKYIIEESKMLYYII